MGRKSTKDNKNVYQLSREELGLTREAAAELLEYISADRIEKIENEKSDNIFYLNIPPLKAYPLLLEPDIF